MARKTKKQKIIADLRRKIKTTDHSLPPTVREEKIDSSFHHQTQSLYIYPVHLTRKDLTKTVLLSILAISLEIALYFVLEKHLVLPFK